MGEVRAALTGARLEVRMDSAFFSDAMVQSPEGLGVKYTISVPFERFAELKGKIEGRRFWWPTRDTGAKGSHFGQLWKPGSWARAACLLLVRTKVKAWPKAPVPLDLFKRKRLT